MQLTDKQIQAINTIKEVKTECLKINESLNNSIKKLGLYYDFEKSELRRIRDKNIRTIQVIQELELKELLE